VEGTVTDNVVVEMLGAMQADLAALRADQAALRTEMQTDMHALRADAEALKGKIDTWPDLHFLQAAAQKQVAEAREAAEFRRYVEIKLDEIYGSMATSSEIKKLRQEVAKSLDRETELDLRISAIEMRLGIKNPLAPTE
jgi:hypothetical protein